MRTRQLPSLLVFGIILITGCSASQSPSADLSQKPDASITIDRWRLAAVGTRMGNDQIEIAMVVGRATDPPRVISEPRILLIIGEQGTVETKGDSVDISITVDSQFVDGRVMVNIDAAIREGGVLKSSPRIRMSIE